MSQKVLVIDQDELQRRWVVEDLSEAGMAVVEACTSSDGLFGALEQAPDVIVMAEEMPVLNGRDLLTLLRRASHAPLIVLGSGGEPTEVNALESGADAYLRKPVRFPALLARIRSLLRRYRGSAAAIVALAKGLGLALTGTEKRLLVCLATNGAGLISRDELLARVWGREASPDVAKFYVRRLRQKLEEVSCGLRLVSVRGVGHRIVGGGMETDDLGQGTYQRRAL